MGKSAHIIIHSASASAAAVGGGLAQIPGSDMPIIVGIQTTMIMTLADHHGAKITRAAAADLLLTFAASYGGRGISQALLGWFPVVGNALNAATAGVLTEAIGWVANEYFADA